MSWHCIGQQCCELNLFCVSGLSRPMFQMWVLWSSRQKWLSQWCPGMLLWQRKPSSEYCCMSGICVFQFRLTACHLLSIVDHLYAGLLAISHACQCCYCLHWDVCSCCILIRKFTHCSVTGCLTTFVLHQSCLCWHHTANSPRPCTLVQLLLASERVHWIPQC